MPPANTNTENPCPLTWRLNLSAFARLAKLPSCTDQEACPVDVGEGAPDSTGAGLGAGLGAGFGAGFGAGLGAAGVSPGEVSTAVSAVPVSAVGELAVGEAADAGAGWGWAGSTSAFAVALLVVRSTVTLRIGSGACAGRVGAGAAFGFGPDSNSGTTSTTSATRIDAPISRSLTRRSITPKYIRDAPPAAAILGTRANRSPARPCERIRTRRFGPGAPLLSRPRRRRWQRCRRR